jgi:hypothetical protein
MPYAVGIADSTTTLVFPLTLPARWTADGLRTIGFGTGQANGAGAVDTELTSYGVFIPANYLKAAGNAIIMEGTMAVAANGDTKLLKVKVGAGTLTTLWSSAANLANHVVPFRVVIRRRLSTSGSVAAVFFDGVASGAGSPAPFMTYTTLGTLDWTTNQVLKLFANVNTATSITMQDYTVYGVRTENGATV